MKKIVRITGSYFPAKKMGGAATADYELDLALTKLGYDVSVLTTYAGLDDYEPISSYNGINVHRFNFYFHPNFFISFGLIFYFINSFLFKLKKIKSNYYFFFSGTWGITSIFLMFLCAIFSLNYSITPHGSLYSELINKKSLFFKKILSLPLKYALNHASFVHYTVKDEMDSAQHIHRNNVNAKVIPLGLNYNVMPQVSSVDAICFRRKYMQDSKNTLLLFVGRINWKKGLDLLFSSVKDISNLEVLCIGPDDENYWHVLDKKFNLTGSSIQYIGALYGDELSTAYASSDIFALTSYSENFAMTVIEACYYNNAIVMTNKVGVSCFFDEYSAAITSTSTNEINKVISRLVSDNAYRDSLAKNASSVCKIFDIDSTAEKIAALVA